ncbi:Isoflavone reductase-like protein IRL [Colletotrichum sp. SAR 10_86]|nr:Isoflavone reductase-like protein IRL [Colletotrichum sp. SAR 10_75]KAI8206900.1 Isoflavone reductase-like protein IRL [Colletotrichum sp. SAR 10_76]KAI8219823.1 Isoflavone reductase-like protein IRL [Colletotrichum sp. SAR 10_86]KAI8239953.1 Isoflavone reductase-like protein IRL [Colletotrichum sp. SAR 10_77]
MNSTSIRKVLVIGASGNVGTSAIKALLEDGFQVTGLTRETSIASLPEGVTHVKSDFSEASLSNVVKGQDAVVSTLSSISPADALASQNSLIDAAIAAGVKVFIPSEYGVDTSDPSAPEIIPFLTDKIATLDYLKKNQDKISWTAIVSGAMFDWGLAIPGFGGWNVAARTVIIYDGGDIPFDATNLDQVGRAISKSLKNPELTKNQHVYVNSFTITQNQVLRALEKVTGEKFDISHGSVEELWQNGAAQVQEGQPLGALGLIAGAVYGKGGLAQYSAKRGLWNEKLGLPEENLEEFLKRYVTGK